MLINFKYINFINVINIGCKYFNIYYIFINIIIIVNWPEVIHIEIIDTRDIYESNVMNS